VHHRRYCCCDQRAQLL